MCFSTRSIQLIKFWNDEDLLDRLMIIFITFVAIRNYYFVLWCFSSFSLLCFLDTYNLSNSLGLKFTIFIFNFTFIIDYYCCQINTVFFGFFFVVKISLGFTAIGFLFSVQTLFTINWFFIKFFPFDVGDPIQNFHLWIFHYQLLFAPPPLLYHI